MCLLKAYKNLKCINLIAKQMTQLNINETKFPLRVVTIDDFESPLNTMMYIAEMKL